MSSLKTWLASAAEAINPKLASHRSAGHFAASFLAFGAFVIATQAALPEGARTSVILLFFLGYPTVLLGAAIAAIRLNAPGFVAGPAAYTVASIAIIGQLMPQALAHARPEQAVFRTRAPLGDHDIVLDAANAERLARGLVQEGKVQSVFYVQRRRIQRVVAANVLECISDPSKADQRCLNNRSASPGDERIEYSSHWSPAAGFNREILRERIEFVGTGGRRTLAEKTTLGRRDVLFIVPMPVFILLPSLASSGLTGESALRDTAPLLSEFFDQVRR